MIDLDIQKTAELRTVDADESAELELPRQPHGLILVTLTDESQWTLATADMEFFAMYLSSRDDPDLASVVLHTGGPTWRLIFGWPASGAACDPDPERNWSLD